MYDKHRLHNGYIFIYYTYTWTYTSQHLYSGTGLNKIN